MASVGYVWEKMLVAVDCLCGEGSFKGRLENAATCGRSACCRATVLRGGAKGID